MVYRYTRAFSALRHLLEELNTPPKYIIKRQILNTMDYGVPQNRNRVHLVGIREDLDGADAFGHDFDLGAANGFGERMELAVDVRGLLLR